MVNTIDDAVAESKRKGSKEEPVKKRATVVTRKQLLEAAMHKESVETKKSSKEGPIIVTEDRTATVCPIGFMVVRQYWIGAHAIRHVRARSVERVNQYFASEP